MTTPVDPNPATRRNGVWEVLRDLVDVSGSPEFVPSNQVANGFGVDRYGAAQAVADGVDVAVILQHVYDVGSSTPETALETDDFIFAGGFLTVKKANWYRVAVDYQLAAVPSGGPVRFYLTGDGGIGQIDFPGLEADGVKEKYASVLAYFVADSTVSFRVANYTGGPIGVSYLSAGFQPLFKV